MKRTLFDEMHDLHEASTELFNALFFWLPPFMDWLEKQLKGRKQA